MRWEYAATLNERMIDLGLFHKDRFRRMIFQLPTLCDDTLRENYHVYVVMCVHNHNRCTPLQYVRAVAISSTQLSLLFFSSHP